MLFATLAVIGPLARPRRVLPSTQAEAKFGLAEFPEIAQQIRDGKAQAAGRLIGAVMKKSGGQADAKRVREMLLARIEA